MEKIKIKNEGKRKRRVQNIKEKNTGKQYHGRYISEFSNNQLIKLANYKILKE